LPCLGQVDFFLYHMNKFNAEVILECPYLFCDGGLGYAKLFSGRGEVPFLTNKIEGKELGDINLRNSKHTSL
jgi:hypothetical protein